MEKVKPIQLFIFKKISNPACVLTLYKGIVEGKQGVSALRWCIKGERNPFPVRCGTWFQGFSNELMRGYLRENGYMLEAGVNLIDQ